MARKRKLAAVLFSLGCLQAGSVWALGLGDITLQSFLNEPLKAKVDLLNTGGLHEDQIKVRLATSDDFDRMGVDRAYFLTGIKFEVKVGANGRGQIILSSEDPVLEPYLDFIVETRWPSGRLLREYTVLVDPPAFDNTTDVISASERVEEVEGIPAPAKKKTEPEVTTGTRVGVGQKSDLAPGEMPQRDFSSGTAAAPAPGARYMIRRDENLWAIAKAARPEGASVHQTMLDIQRLNPDAFIDGNINRIKAGYIIYLPSAEDISSADLEKALAEVKQQNEDWRAGRASTPAASSSGPSLKISASEPEPGDAGSAARSGTASPGTSPGADAAMESLERSELENAELQGRLDAMSDQVETLENIVSVKDEQIAALQKALREANVDVDGADGGVAGDASGLEAEGGSAAPVPVEEAPVEAAAEPEPAPAAKPAPKPAPQPPADSGSWTDNLLYPGIAVLALIGGLLLWRRRKSAEEEAEADRDVFAGVELKEQELDVDDTPEPATEVAPEPAPAAPATNEERGYGQRKHDEYASDVDTGDALAEADIYIAYGRYPQAIELLRNAIGAEPGNPVFRLKLLELFVRTGREGDAREQLAALREIGDDEAIASAEAALAAADDQTEFGSAATAAESSTPTVGNPTGAAPSSFEAAPEFEENAATDDGFSDLEIEDDFSDLDDDLDLSKDFESSDPDAEDDDDDDELVFASEGNPVATKLDLARAYIDMGDEAGARQILEEVLQEGSTDQQQEAQGLIDRLD
ncbi:tetratricopeptide repeat protein [Parahaliea maris]|uniref:Tetratricopeptide repeat protein n=1 Tax=Parahaliea maris TaxID=2716870 RepID=A0A5C9A6P8_9GAMM|nr:FimV/HubP family polar landmark protein [Parahaliea maris]TXS95684.1 tetratricopeptide repeat protein [Parahaliea maris]